MVDGISGNNSIHEAGLAHVSQQQSVEKTNVESSKGSESTAALGLFDQATISDEAKKAYAGEKELLRFSRLAQRVKPDYDPDKVAQFKNMLDSGRINDYLRNLNTDSLANEMLNSPSGAFLR